MKLKAIDRKKFRVTNKVKKVSSPNRFRLSISRSSKNISAQIIDDVKNITLLSSSSIEKDVKAMDKVNKTEISIKPKKVDQNSKRLWGMNRSLINNAVIGSSTVMKKYLSWLVLDIELH